MGAGITGRTVEGKSVKQRPWPGLVNMKTSFLQINSWHLAIRGALQVTLS